MQSNLVLVKGGTKTLIYFVEGPRPAIENPTQRQGRGAPRTLLIFGTSNTNLALEAM
jgi:hypothetical protein